jgi:hypothetical protein
MQAANLAALPLAAKVAMLVLVIVAMQHTTREVITLHRQGFLKAAPTARVTLCAMLVTYQIGGIIGASFGGFAALLGLITAGGIRRTAAMLAARRAAMRTQWQAMFAAAERAKAAKH